MKKILALTLSILLLCTCLFSCDESFFDDLLDENIDGSLENDDANESKKPSTQKGTDKEKETQFTDVIGFPTLDFDDETITILHRDSVSFQREWHKDVFEDELDEVIALRNEAVSKILGIDVEYQSLAGSNYTDCLDNFTNAIKEDVNTGKHNYDIVANHAYASANIAIRDYLADLTDKNTFPYFQFSLPCWNQSIVKNTTLNGMLFHVTGDLNLSTFDNATVVFLNKDMYDAKKTSLDPEDLQEVAISGAWDFEDLYRWTTVFENTNGKNGAQHDDFYAISAAFDSTSVDALSYAWELNYLTTNPDGSHKYNIVGNQKIENAIVKAQNLLNGSISAGVNNANDTGACSLGGYSEPITHFASNKSIFAIHKLYASDEDNNIIRSMEAKFGILPMPKYTEAQENYKTTVHDSYTLISVIDHSESSVPTKGNEISAYLQYSYEESYVNIRGFYVNKIIKPKYFGTFDDTQERELVNIILDSIELDVLSVYAPQLNNVLARCWRDVVMGYGSPTTAKDAYEFEKTNFDTSLESLDYWFGIE